MMKLGFSTLGCPDWPYATIVAKAREYGFDGFEIRGLMGEMDLLKVPECPATRRPDYFFATDTSTEELHDETVFYARVPRLAIVAKPGRRAETLRMAADAGLEIMMLMTGCKFSSAAAD